MNKLLHSVAASIDSAVSAVSPLPAPAASRTVSARVQSLVDEACLNGHSLNLDAALRVCDLVNDKGNSYPREVAFTLVKYVNSRHDTIAALNSIGMIDADHRNGNTAARYETSALNALQLLDMLVKNCGYPFQLTISSKEFLNELVKRFPEKPSAGNVVQFRILELIQQWNSTLCVNSRYKEDFRSITDMYRLLSYKGYRFPGVSSDSAAVLSVSNALKSEVELEEEDRVAQGAKLQELLRLGTPASLEQANELMKVLSGYESEGKPDYSKTVADELERIEAKASALNILFQQPNPSKREIDELMGAMKTAQGRIQTIISNGEQEDRIERLLQLNDDINTTLENYQRFRAGQPITSVSFMAPSTNASVQHSQSSANATSPATGAISLIDFDDSTIPSSSPFAAENFQMSAIAGSQLSSNSASNAPSTSSSAGSTLNDLTGLDFFGSAPQQSSLKAVQPLTSIPARGVGMMPQYGMGLGGGNLGMGASHAQAIATPQKPQPVQPTSSNLLDTSFDLLNQSLNTPKATSPVIASVPAPMQNMKISNEPKEARIFNKNGLQIKMKYSIDASNVWQGQAIFINTTPVAFDQLNFQVAVPKVMQVKLLPLTGTTVAPLNQSQVTQTMSIVNPSNEALKLRFRVSYDLNGALVEESGEHVF
ncbi:hypothetical protein HDU78_004726 [Chytriomyces hyalinus]|nr:hypothetical protein HDU78_004726 [Chytriomyces hyalinus]